MASLPLPLRKDLRDNEAKRNAHLERIAKATGTGPWTFEADFADVNAKISASYQNRLGEILYDSYLDCLAKRLETLCKDDMVKEAIVGVTGAKKIVYRLGTSASYHPDTIFEGGVLILQQKPENFWSNVSDVGNDIEKKL